MTTIPFDNSYARLPDNFYARLPPTPVTSPHLIRLNEQLAEQLGIDISYLQSDEGLSVLSGNHVPEGAEPLAMAYAGHQFGHFVPQLGDGRANLLGEIVAGDGIRRDIQLKGAGPTPFSRSGDGRAALGPVLREYIVSEAMHQFGVPTTRALAATMTGEKVARERFLPGAILTRVAQSHIRVGTFQYFAARENTQAIRQLADHVISRHYPDAANTNNPYQSLLDGVIAKQASLIAHWLSLGFIHGVMNTDNMSIAGETIDYGPCAFMDTYNPGAVFSSVDQMGRYAFTNQPSIAQWNLSRFAQCLLPLLDDDEDKSVEIAQASIDRFPGTFESQLAKTLGRKIGLLDASADDLELARELLHIMAKTEADFTLTFTELGTLAAHEGDTRQAIGNYSKNPSAFDEWTTNWHARLALTKQSTNEIIRTIKAANPAIIPRNHLIEEVIEAAEDGNFNLFHDLVQALGDPYADQAENSRYLLPPRPEQVVTQTFCGT